MDFDTQLENAIVSAQDSGISPTEFLKRLRDLWSEVLTTKARYAEHDFDKAIAALEKR